MEVKPKELNISYLSTELSLMILRSDIQICGQSGLTTKKPMTQCFTHGHWNAWNTRTSTEYKDPSLRTQWDSGRQHWKVIPRQLQVSSAVSSKGMLYLHLHAGIDNPWLRSRMWLFCPSDAAPCGFGQ